MFSHSHKETACTRGPDSVCVCERYRVWVKLDANTHGIYYLADGRFSSVCCMMLHLPCAIGLKLKAISISSYRITFVHFSASLCSTCYPLHLYSSVSCVTSTLHSSIEKRQDFIILSLVTLTRLFSLCSVFFKKAKRHSL